MDKRTLSTKGKLMKSNQGQQELVKAHAQVGQVAALSDLVGCIAYVLRSILKIQVSAIS